MASDVVAMLSGVPVAVTMMLSACVAVCAFGLVESLTCTVKLKVPAEVGVPEMAPVAEARLRPAGSEPWLMLQVYGDVPPLAARVALYTPACVPSGSAVVEIVTGTEIPILKFFLAFCGVGEVESVTCTVKAEMPEDVGVPEMVPVEADRISPVGSDPEVTLQL